MKTMMKKTKKIVSASAILAFAVLFVLAFFLLGDPILEFVKDPPSFRAWIDSMGIIGILAYFGMVIIQVIVAIIPGEPLEICAGFAFGAINGTLIALIAETAGSILVFLFVRKIGLRAIEVFFPREKIDSLKFLQDTGKVKAWLFILLFIPGTPKDLICYVAGMTKISLLSWTVINLIARIPSIITSTIGADAIIGEKYMFAAIVFAVTVLISITGIIIYNIIVAKKGKSN